MNFDFTNFHQECPPFITQGSITWKLSVNTFPVKDEGTLSPNRNNTSIQSNSNSGNNNFQTNHFNHSNFVTPEELLENSSFSTKEKPIHSYGLPTRIHQLQIFGNGKYENSRGWPWFIVRDEQIKLSTANPQEKSNFEESRQSWPTIPSTLFPFSFISDPRRVFSRVSVVSLIEATSVPTDQTKFKSRINMNYLGNSSSRRLDETAPPTRSCDIVTGINISRTRGGQFGRRRKGLDAKKKKGKKNQKRTELAHERDENEKRKRRENIEKNENGRECRFFADVCARGKWYARREGGGG